MSISQFPVSTLDVERFRAVLGPRFEEIEYAVSRGARIFRGRVIWHVNSTARGGGVAELLQSLLGYARGAGVDARRLVIDGEPDFFRVTKRIHNHLHGWEGDSDGFSEADREVYEETLAANASDLAQWVMRGDIVFCHDPQTAGLVEPLVEAGATVVWRCHVGLDLPNDIARGAWEFLRPYVEPAHAYVFSRREFVWEGLDQEKIWIVPPSIDIFSPKNQDLPDDAVAAIFGRAGLGPATGGPATFTRMDGTPGRVDRAADVDQDAPVAPEVPLIAQVSRWDGLKDPVGVIRGFVEHCRHPEAHLLLAGPSVDAVADDPEGAEVLAQVRLVREQYPADVRARLHLACLPMDDIEENAAIVNAIQRRAQVVVQKSLAEGFGLTVAEAMWKARPVIASRRGGIQDQIPNGDLGLLLDDPSDLEQFGQACDQMLDDPQNAAEMGIAARAWIIEHFLGSRHLVQYLRLLDGLLERSSQEAKA